MKKVTVRQLLIEIEQLENCGCFSPFLGVTESDFRKSAQKGPKSDPIAFKICMSPLYTIEENRRQGCIKFLIPHPSAVALGGGKFIKFLGEVFQGVKRGR